MAYCRECGKHIEEGSGVCGSCGYKMPQNAKLVLSTKKKTGFLKSIQCYLVFYDTNVVLAYLDKDRQKEESERYKSELKEQGKGFFKTAAAMMKFLRNYGEKYYYMHRQLVLEDDPENRAIDYVKIVKFIFRAVNRTADDSSGNSTYGEIKIKTLSENMNFIHSYYDSNKMIKDILSESFGRKLKYRGGTQMITIGRNRNRIN